MGGFVEAAGQGLVVELLGLPAVRSAAREGLEVRLGPRAAVVLARLALGEGSLVSREGLADAVWGEELPASWRGSLRNVVSELRGALRRVGAGGVLETVGETYRLELPPGSRVDVLALERDARASRRAVQAGDPAGAWERASPWLGFEARALLPGIRSEWVDELRRRVESVREDLLVTAGRAALELGDAGAAAGLARRAIELSPWLEEAHRVLIGALVAEGNRGAALAAYRRLRELLASELGVEPSEPTERLRRRLMGDAPSPPVRLASVIPIGEWRRSADYGLDMAGRAFRASEYQDVVAIANRTLEALHAAGDPDAIRRLDLLILLGAAQRALGLGDGFATLQTTVELARRLERWERLADAVLAFMHAGAAADEHYVEHTLSELYEEALTRLPEPDQGRRAPLLGHLAVAYAYSRGGPRVKSAVEEALALARRQSDERTLLQTLTLARRAIWGHLELDAQERLEDEILELALRLDEPSAHASALLWRFMTRIEQCQGQELESILDQADRVVAGLQMGHYHHTLAYSRGVLAIIRGDLEASEKLIDEAVRIGRARGISELIIDALRITQLEGLRHEQGRLEEIRDQVLAVYGGAGQPLWLGMVAVVEAETGHLKAAARCLRKFLDTYEARGPTLLAPVPVAAYTSHAIHQLNDERSAERLHRLIASHAGRGGYLAYFPGPIDYHLGLLAKTLGQTDQAERHFKTAVALCQRLGAPLWTERCRELTAKT